MDDRIICFIHSCTLPIWGTQILEQILNQIKVTGLYEKLDQLFINNIGTPLHRSIPGFEKAILTNYSTDPNLFENCTLRQMVFFTQFNPGVKILYLHTKGVSHTPDSPYLLGIKGWVEFMLYSLVNKSAECIQMLDKVDVVGVDYRHGLFDKNGSHFSGNFWWARANYLRTMPIHELRDKYDAEFWLFRNQPRYINIHSCPHGHCERYYPPDEYETIVNTKIEAIIIMMTQIQTLSILYGIEGRYLDVTSICRDRLCHDGTLTIPAGDFERNDIFTDPVPNVIKHIRIGDLTYGFKEELRIPYL